LTGTSAAAASTSSNSTFASSSTYIEQEHAPMPGITSTDGGNINVDVVGTSASQNEDVSGRGRSNSSKKDCRVYVGNLAYEVGWQDLKDFMRKGIVCYILKLPLLLTIFVT
jgi:hypothetical protein